MNVVKTVRTLAGYAAMAIGVTVAGVAIGALVVAPVLAPVLAPVAAPVFTHAVRAPEVHGAAGSTVSAMRLATDFIRAVPNMDRIPNIVWLFVAGMAALLVLALTGWRIRRRSTVAAPSATHLAAMATASLPSRVVVDRRGGTPRAVLALAEAGTASADIARRTGLSLDAVALCLAMSPGRARQLRPPTA